MEHPRAMQGDKREPNTLILGCPLLWFQRGCQGGPLPGNGRGMKTKGAGVRERFGAGVSVWGEVGRRRRGCRRDGGKHIGQRETRERGRQTETREREGEVGKGEAERCSAEKERDIKTEVETEQNRDIHPAMSTCCVPGPVQDGYHPTLGAHRHRGRNGCFSGTRG